MAGPRVSKVPWKRFRRSFDWRQGEHVSLLGPTWSGKTTLALSLLGRRDYQLVIATKPRDPLISDLEERGYMVNRSEELIPAKKAPKQVVWPPVETRRDVDDQQRVLAGVLDQVYVDGGWTVYVDEMLYLSDTLRLGRHLEILWQQGRTLGVSLMGGTQRPAHVPRAAYSQATHLFLWKTSDLYDARRLRDVAGGPDPRFIINALSGLSRYEFLYINTRSGQTAVSQVDLRRENAA